jgi:hypothetical protein
MEENKKILKDLNKQVKEHYESDAEYERLMQQSKEINEKKKLRRNILNEDITDLLTQRDDVKIDLASDKELLTDVLLTGLAKGENLKLVDEYKQEMFPLFSVKFEKA